MNFEKKTFIYFQRKCFNDELAKLMSVMYSNNSVMFIKNISSIIYFIRSKPDLQKVGKTLLTNYKIYLKIFSFQKFVDEFKTMSSRVLPKDKLKDFHSTIYMDLLISLIITKVNFEVDDIFQLLNNAKKLARYSLSAAQKNVL